MCVCVYSCVCVCVCVCTCVRACVCVYKPARQHHMRALGGGVRCEGEDSWHVRQLSQQGSTIYVYIYTARQRLGVIPEVLGLTLTLNPRRGGRWVVRCAPASAVRDSCGSGLIARVNLHQRVRVKGQP